MHGAFAIVVETGSFVHASARLSLTAPAVSKQVSKLENTLSIRLLKRSARRLKVNAEGARNIFALKRVAGIFGHCI
ncbi:MAG TPA: hypothetical protein DIT96_03040 [Pseudomonas sp.]|nr:hypothetical protein [Pseudomonas sp.]